MYSKSFTGWVLLSSKSNSQSNRNGLLNSSIAHHWINAKSEKNRREKEREKKSKTQARTHRANTKGERFQFLANGLQPNRKYID